jgi:hypothetical protein
VFTLANADPRRENDDVKATTLPSNPAVLLAKLLKSGAVMHMEGKSPDEFAVLAAEHLLLEDRLIYHIPFADYSEHLHKILLSGILATSPSRIEIMRDGLHIATILPIGDATEKEHVIWSGWQQWREIHDVEYYESITAHLHDYDPENGGH